MVRAARGGTAICIVLASLYATGAHAECKLPTQTPKPGLQRDISTGDLAGLRDIGTPDSSLSDLPSPLAVSPDGKQVAFVLSQGDPAENRTCRWLVAVDVRLGGHARVLDSGGEIIPFEASVRGLQTNLGLSSGVTPAWSPDGQRLAYLRRDDGKTAIRVVDASGQNARFVAHTVNTQRWAWVSNDKIAITTRPTLAAIADIEAQGRQGWLYDERFTPQSAARPQLPGDLPSRTDVVNLTGGTTSSADEQVREGVASLGAGDEQPLELTRASGIFSVKPDASTPFSPGRLHFTGNGAREVPCSAAQCAGGIVRLLQIDATNTVFFIRQEGWAHSETALYRWKPNSGAPVRMFSTSDVLLGCIPHDSKLLCLRETATRPRHIALIDPMTGNVHVVYDPNPEFTNLRLGAVTHLRWTNDRGLPARGDLVLPPGLKSGTRVPLVVVQYHSDGFLRGGTGDEYPIYPLAARGFAVLSFDAPGPVAKTMTGMNTWDDVRRAGVRDWAERRSILSAVETGVRLAVATGAIDPKHIGITGLSDGASTARFALLNSSLFTAAAVSGSSLEPKTMMTYGGIAWADMNRRSGFPLASVEDLKFWSVGSLAANAKRLYVPLLIQAPDDEYLLSLETFTALREQGKPVELHVFPDEHHVKNQPAHRLSIYNRVIDWMSFWLQGREDPAPEKVAQYERWRAMRVRQASH